MSGFIGDLLGVKFFMRIWIGANQRGHHGVLLDGVVVDIIKGKKWFKNKKMRGFRER